MKNLIKILCAVAIVIAVACSKDGATGPQGPAGTNGTNGTDGNANVTVYKFATDFVLSTVTTYKEFTLTGMTQGRADSSLILGFFQEAGCSTYWYNCPGLGCAAGYNTRSFTFLSGSTINFEFVIHDADGTAFSGTNKTFTNFKVIVIPASNVINGRTRDPRTMTYNELCKTYNIKD